MILLIVVAAPRGVRAQTPAATDASAGPTVPMVQEQIRLTEGASDLDAALKPQLLEQYKESIEQLKAEVQWTDQAKAWQSRRKQDPEELAKLKAKLEQPTADVSESVTATGTLAQLEQQLADNEALLKKAQRNLADVDPKPRRDQLPQLIAAAQKRLKEADDELARLPPPSDSLNLPEAKRMRWSTAKRAVQAELAAYDNERVWYEANTALVTAKLDSAAQDVRRAEAIAVRCRDVLNERRQQEAVKQAEEARRAAFNATLPQLKAFADHNAALTQEQSGPDGFPAKNAAIAKELNELRKEQSSLTAKFTRVQDRIRAAGLNNAVGLALQKQQTELPDLHAHRQRLSQAQSEESYARAKQIELEDQRAELADLDGYVAKVMDTLPATLPKSERAEVEQALRRLLKARQEYLDSQIQAARTFDDLIMDFISIEADLIAEIVKYKRYIGERILWVRSAPVIGYTDLQRAWDGLVKLADAGQGLGVLRELAGDVGKSPGIYLVASLFLVPLFVGRRRLRRRIDAIDQQTAQNYAAEIRPTIEVAILTCLISAVWPAVVALLALRLSLPAGASLHAQSIAYGLRVTAIAFLSLEFVRQMCRRKGLAEAHFGWPSDGLALVRKHIRWAMLLGLPLCFVVAVVEAPEYDLHRSPLGRIAFISSLLVIAAFAHCVLHPHRGLLQSLSSRKDVSWIWRSPRIWHLLAVSGPIALAIVAASGYFYTALILAWRLHATLLLLLGLLIVQAFAQRCLLVARRKLAIKHARERRAAALLAQQQSHVPAEPAAAAAATSPVDLVTIDVQTRRLLRSSINVALAIGCWLIWIDVLPALGILDRYGVWHYYAEEPHAFVAEPHASSDPGDSNAARPESDALPTRTIVKWVTLGDLLLCGVVVIMTIVAGRNLPGLLEIAFLQRLPMDPGGRYATTTVSRYVITLFGVAVAFRMVGIGWSNIQWLVAAMTVGLGFGLQEIFANFISGLIILFERPVRVGDIVTIGGTTGAVSRIRIRATTITDGDRKELIVPNKEFITGQLINWTLSDRILRMVIRVGVAYGSDVALARRLLMKAAEEDARVLHDPAPTAFFEEFSDSTLNFELRIFFEGLEHFVDIRHDLNARIDHLFREAGIEMAFPQCDIHVRSLDTILNAMPPRVEPLKRAS